MYEPTQNQFPQLAFLWPALAAASASEAAAMIARQFVELAGGSAREVAEPEWTTPGRIALDLQAVRLRDFSTTGTGTPALLCAPFALHGASITDLAPGHSLIQCLRAAGTGRLYVTDWRPAAVTMRYLGIDDYLATLNVLVDDIGGPVDLVGLCQNGWLALIYAARFPAKVRKLVLAGAPIDVAAAPSGLAEMIARTPEALFEEMVKLGDGRVIGGKVLGFWGPETVGPEEIHRTLEAGAPLGSDASRSFSSGSFTGTPGPSICPAGTTSKASNASTGGTNSPMANLSVWASVSISRTQDAALSSGGARRRVGDTAAIVRDRSSRRHAGGAGSYRARALPPSWSVHGAQGVARAVVGNRAVAGRGR